HLVRQAAGGVQAQVRRLLPAVGRQPLRGGAHRRLRLGPGRLSRLDDPLALPRSVGDRVLARRRLTLRPAAGRFVKRKQPVRSLLLHKTSSSGSARLAWYLAGPSQVCRTVHQVQVGPGEMAAGTSFSRRRAIFTAPSTVRRAATASLSTVTSSA